MTSEVNRAFSARAFGGAINPGALPQAGRESRAFGAINTYALEERCYCFTPASSTARLIAAIMLSGRAILLPTISNAVP